jgi:membrane protein
MTTDAIESRIETPVRLVQQVLDNLAASGIINAIIGKTDKTIAYQPAKNIDLLTIGYVTEVLKQHCSDNLPLSSSPELEIITNQMQSLKQELKQSSHNILLKDIRITEKHS